MSEFVSVRLAVSHGPDLHFDGKLAGSYSTQNRAGTKDRWTELRLWETPAGNWVAESVGVSTRGHEGEIREARVIEVEEVDRAALGKVLGTGADAYAASHRADDDEYRRMAAMGVWGWTTAAKAFARELGWDVIRRVE